MNENEKTTPFSSEEGNEVTDKESTFEPAAEEVFEQEAKEDTQLQQDIQPEFMSQPEAVSEEEAAQEPEITAEPEFTAEREATQESVAEASQSFNPYAPKNPQAEAQNDYSNVGVNATYGNVVNSQTPDYQNKSEFNRNYGYNSHNPTPNPNPNYNSSYNYNGGYKPPEESDKKGRKIAVGIVAACIVVAIIALVSAFFGKGENPQPSTSGSTDGVLPTETTVPTTIPPVTSSEAQTQATQAATTTTNATTAATTSAPATQVVNSIWVAEKVRPSVVGVIAYKQGELAGEGSGVLMCEDDNKTCTYIVTCAHVINDSSCDFSILLLDGTSYEATVVAIDERTDIGVLKVEQTGLPLAEFGDSTTLKVGEPIYAIGNPGGSEYFGSITNGIVASIDRSISATYTMTCIQHNAAINPGNSGGALVNTAGQVIGINSSKIAKTDYEGMGFAVPSAIFGSVVNSLIKHGYVPNRPELGIKYATISEYQLYSIIVSIKKLPKGSIIIAEIPEGSALAGTEAQVGDLITAVNGKKMDSSDVLLDLIDTGAVGDTLTLTLCRINERNYDVSTFDVTVQLVENKGSITTTTQPQTLPQQDDFGDFEDFFGGFFGW